MSCFLKLLCVVVSFVATPASGCNCWHPEPEQYLSAAKLIFRGTVTSVNPASIQMPLPAGAGVSVPHWLESKRKAKFKLTESYKGPSSGEIEVGYTASDGTNCGWNFAVGDKVTVFASGSRRSGFVTDLCMMIPFQSYTKRGDDRYLTAIDEYRKRRNQFASDIEKKGPSEQLFLQQAEFFAKHKDYDDADVAYGHLLQLKPKDASALTARADIRYAMKRFDDALADYVAAIEIDVTNLSAWRGRIAVNAQVWGRR
jgi:hypothetical protein